MNIAIDIDGTWDRDVNAFCDLVNVLANEHGHTIYIVTSAREVNYIKIIRLHLDGAKIIRTSGAPKKSFCDALGIHIDIWIDDNPASITSQFIKPNTDDEL